MEIFAAAVPLFCIIMYVVDTFGMMSYANQMKQEEEQEQQKNNL